jgi:PAS domain S-box-containing protein
MTARGRPETILIVEDNPITRKVLRVALQSAGYTAVEAPDGRRALEQARDYPPALIIQDLRLPDMDGIDLVARLRALPEARDIPILAFSGLQSKVEEARSLQSGFTDYLFKPVEPSRLLEIVAEHLRQTRGPTTGVGYGRRILLVDDDPVQLKLQRLNLQGAGFQVSTARDGLEALETARAERPDAIVTDLIMPRLGGLDFCLAVRRDPALAQTPIVLSSSTYSDLSPSDRALAREAGANSFVARTPDSEDMIRHVVEALASGDAPIPKPDIEGVKAVYSEALIQQLERQTELNRRLLRRAAIQTGQLSVLTGISETLSRSRDPDVAINEILARVLDASGTSAGAIFLVESGVRLLLRCHIGIRQGGESLLARFYGHAELLSRSMMDSKVLLLPSTELGETGDEVVRGAGCGSMIIIPLVAPEGPQGVMIINSDETGLEERWIESVKVIASQLGQAILLARTLERLTESEQRYRGLFDGVPIGLYRIASTGQFLEANPAMLQLLGYTDVKSLLAARLPDHCVEEADRRRWDLMLRHVEAARNEELRMRRCDGSVIWVRNTTRAIPDEKRAAICYEGSAEDITARREAEDALRRNYNLLHAVIDNTPDAIFVKDLQGRYLMVNAADASLLGRAPDQILGQTDQDLFLPETAREIAEIDRKILEHGATQVSEQGFRIRGQSHTYLSLRGIYRDSEGKPAGVFGIARDITERKHAEEALAERARLAALVADVGLALTQAEALPQVLQRCTEAAVNHLGGAFARIWTLNEETQTLELQASAGMYTHLDGAHGRVRVGESKIGLIARERRPHLSNTVVGDLRVSDQEWARREGMVAFAGHPLVVEDRVVGVFAMFSRHPFSEATFQALGAVSDEIALGIERKRAEEAVRRSEARYRLFFEHNPNPMWVCDTASLAFRAVNDAALHQYGYSREEFLTMTISDIRPAAEQRQSTSLSPASEDPLLPAVWRHQRKDGSELYVEITGQKLIFEGRPAELILAQDITQRRRSQEALRESEERFRQLAENTHDVFFVQNRDFSELLYVSPAYEEVWGRPCQDLYKTPGSFLFDDVFPEDRERLLDSVLRNQSGHETGAVEFRIRRPDGQVRWIQARSAPVRNTRGEVYRIVGVALDITEQKRAEEALRESETQFRSLSDSSPLGIFLTDAAAQCVYTNPKWQEITGMSLGEAFGDGWLNAVHPEDRDDDRASWANAQLHGSNLDGERRIQTPAGDVRLVRTRAAAIKDANGAVLGWVGTVEDNTERRALEEQFRQAQKMEAIGQLAGGVAHDFNNLLTAILGYAEMMLLDMSASDPRREDAEEIVSAAERAGALTRQLLAFSRQQVLEPRVLNLNEVISQLTRMLRRLLNEDIELVTQLSDELGSVKADVGQIEQVILNLCVNARDAMPGGGKLTIETVNAELDTAYVSLHQPVRPGAYVMLAISDTGQGMSAETQRRIFEPFFTTKGVGKGTGLGLATVYGIVKQSDGYIWVYSEVGRGTAFKIYLPLIDEAPSGMARARAERGLAAGSETILLVEDEEIVRKLARQVLERQGYHLLVAKSGQEALEMAGNHKGALDLIVTDVVMPGMQGPELAERLKRGHPHCRVLYISGYAPEAVVRHGVLQPGTNFIGKPFTPALFAQRVRELLDQPEGRAES